VRILFVNQYFPPDAAATAYILGELAEDLALDHEVHVVAGKPSYNATSSNFRPKGVRVHRAASTVFHRGHVAGRLTNYATFLISSTYRCVRVPRPELVVAMTDPPLVGIVGLAAAKRFGCPFVFVSHDVHPDIGVALGRMDNPLLVWAVRAVNRLLRRSASQIIVVGRDMQEKMIAEGVAADKLTYLPNWATRTEQVSAADVRARMGWSDRVVVMHAGNIGLAQNLNTLLQAASLLKDRTDILFVLVGDGAAKGELTDQVTLLGLENVVFEPYRPKEEAQELVGASDIQLISLAPGLKGCAAPSKTYGIMAAGKPFIAAVDSGSEPDRIITEFGCGIRVEPNDGPGMARAIAEVTHESLDEMGARALAAFSANFERHIVTAGYQETLERVLQL
jgi:colanic acid biosynthesis glycosyl transferase WcaI